MTIDGQFKNIRVLWLGIVLLSGLLIFIGSAAADATEDKEDSFLKEDNSSSIPSVLAEAGEANDSSTIQAKDKTLQNPAWTPPPPPPDDFDWIQLKSGEWLKGELRVLYDNSLEFDSEELDLLKFDWEDVKQVRCHQIHSVRFEGPDVTIAGVLQITDGKVIVVVGDKEQKFERNRVVSVAKGEPKEINYWSAKVSLGLNISKGNTDQVEYSSRMNIQRRTSASRFVADFLGNYASAQGHATVESNRVDTYFDIFKTRRYYFRPIFGQYFRDPFQNIEFRGNIGTGIGYHIINTSRTEWDVTSGVAYQYTQFVSVEPGEDSSKTTPALVAGTQYDIKLTKRLDFNARYNFQIINEASGRYTHHVMTTLEAELTSRLDFDISLVWDRVQSPSPREDSTLPDQNDFRMIFSLGWDF